MNKHGVTPWLLHFGAKPNASLRLFCLPFAGGAASMYRSWADQFPDHIELVGVQLPGRENRLIDPPIDSINALVAEIATEIQPYLDKPYAIYGHSMGALVNFELSRQLRRMGAPMPTQLFVSAYRAPHLPNRHEKIHQLPTPQFLTKIRELNGTPEGILQNQELVGLILPMLRADFQIHESYVYQEEPPLAVPLLACGGIDDSRITLAEVRAWEQHTNCHFRFQKFAGDHFFIKSQQRAFCALLVSAMSHRELNVYEHAKN